MEGITIRRATPADLDILLEFEQGVIHAERPFDSTLKDGDINYYDIAGMIATADVEVLVAELASEIIGSGYARIETSKIYFKHQKHAYLGFMYVRPDHRGKGVNSKIIKALQQWASEQGVTECRLKVYHDNMSAIKAYEKLGFTSHLIEMRVEASSNTNDED